MPAGAISPGLRAWHVPPPSPQLRPFEEDEHLREKIIPPTRRAMFLTGGLCFTTAGTPALGGGLEVSPSREAIRDQPSENSSRRLVHVEENDITAPNTSPSRSNASS